MEKAPFTALERTRDVPACPQYVILEAPLYDGFGGFFRFCEVNPVYNSAFSLPPTDTRTGRANEMVHHNTPT